MWLFSASFLRLKPPLLKVAMWTSACHHLVLCLIRVVVLTRLQFSVGRYYLSIEGWWHRKALQRFVVSSVSTCHKFIVVFTEKADQGHGFREAGTDGWVFLHSWQRLLVIFRFTRFIFLLVLYTEDIFKAMALLIWSVTDIKMCNYKFVCNWGKSGSGDEAGVHRCSMFVSIGCLHKDRGTKALLEVLSFTYEGFSLILLSSMNITWIKSKHMVSYSNASIILPFLTMFFLFLAVKKVFVSEVTISEYRNSGAIPVRNWKQETKPKKWRNHLWILYAKEICYTWKQFSVWLCLCLSVYTNEADQSSDGTNLLIIQASD